MKTTCVYIHKGSQVLLLNRNKKDQDINHGKWIGVGGKVEPGETPKACALREIKEETGLVVSHLTWCGILHFKQDLEETIYIYEATTEEEFQDNGREGTLAWIEENQMDTLPMWPADRLFLEKMKKKEIPFELTVQYEGDKIVQVIDHKKEKI